jgi:membrane protease subunit HflK
MTDEPQDQGPEQSTPKNEAPQSAGQDVDLASGDSLVSDQAPDDELISTRAASVRFNRTSSTGKVSNKDRMDAANQSLADALRITYGFLQFGMIILLILFVFSGFQKINEGEQGIAVFLGKPSRAQLEPGAHLTWPYPIGELIRVGGGTVEVPLARIFMPNAPGANSEDSLLDLPIDRFSGVGRLNPLRDGSLITADLNIAHAQWTVNYHRSNHLRFVENILPEQEISVIVIAVRRGVVRTMAETPIDDLLKKSAETMAAQVKEIAQETLDGLESGITIDRVVLVRKTPPLALLDQFASVQSAAQNAGKEREDALLQQDQWLNEVAGRSADILIEMINEYERLIELNLSDEAATLLETIDIALSGGEVEYNGVNTSALVSGEVSEILNAAQSKASSRVSQAIADLEQFNAKQAQFEANPILMVVRDWSSAMTAFLEKDFVTTMYLPENVDVELLINNDPDIERERDRIRKREESLKAVQQRREDFKNDIFKSRRGITEEEGP